MPDRALASQSKRGSAAQKIPQLPGSNSNPIKALDLFSPPRPNLGRIIDPLQSELHSSAALSLALSNSPSLSKRVRSTSKQLSMAHSEGRLANNRADVIILGRLSKDHTEW